jgi:hypothetical protein
MSLKKLCCMFAVVVLMMLFSVTAASACTHDHSATDSGEHVGHTNHRVKSSTISLAPIGEHKEINLKDHTAGTLKSPIGASAAMTSMQEPDDDGEGSCIHGNGCTCSGSRSHIRGCGTNGDCHAHPGLVCTWGGGAS